MSSVNLGKLAVYLVCVQSKVSEALCCQDECVQQLRKLWEKTQLTGAHSFELAMTQTTVPHKKVKSLPSLFYFLSVCHSHKHSLTWTNMHPITQHLPLPPAHLLVTHPWCLKGLFSSKIEKVAPSKWSTQLVLYSKLGSRFTKFL